MRRVFVKNILFILTINLLIKSVWIFMIDRTVQNRVGHEAYGIYQALFNLGIIFQIVLDFGLNNYNTRMISQRPGRLQELFPVMLSTRLVLLLIYIFTVTVAGWTLGFRGEELLLLGGVLLIQGFNILLQYIRSNVAALQQFRTDGLLSVSDRFLMILVCGALLWHPATAAEFRIGWFVIAQIACYGLAFVVALFVLKRIAHVPLRLSFHFGDILKVIRGSLPYALLIFLMAVYTRSDMLLIERLCGDEGREQAGIYAAAFRLLDVGNIFGLIFAGVLLPMFGRMLEERGNLAPVIRVAVNIMIPLSIAVAVAAAFYGTEIMQALYPVSGAYDGLVLSWVMASFPAFCIMYIYSTLLTANGDLKLLNTLAAVAVALNITANLILIPRYQALGAAVTAFVTQSGLAICFILAAQRKLQLPYAPKWALAHIGFGVIAFVAGLACTWLPAPWIVQLLCFGAIVASVIFAFRFVTIKNLGMLLKSREKA
jgi:O-antigen/teichoic acid export membrane protein